MCNNTLFSKHIYIKERYFTIVSNNDSLTCVLNSTAPVHSSNQYYVADHDKNERDQKHYHEQVVENHLK